MQPVPPEEVERRWSGWLLERNRRGTKVVLWIGLTLYPLFGILDYLVAPHRWLWVLYCTRGFVFVVTLVMFHLVRGRLFDRFPHALSASYMILGSFGISLMTLFMGGLSSPYYAGLSLIIVAIGLLFVWPSRIVLMTHGTIIASFIGPNILAEDPGSIAAVSNLFFLVSTAVIISAGQILSYRSQREQQVNQLIIERTKTNLEQAHEQLKQLDRFKSQFFANITHELKTPLAMILTPLELVLDGSGDGKPIEAQRATFEGMYRSGVKLLKLIDDLLDLSKLEESRLRLRIDEHDLVAYVRGLLSQVQPLAQRKGIALHFESIAPVSLVWCDLERIERVFINLLSNATKFTPAGGNVWLRMEDEGDRVSVEVRDDGPGFPPDMSTRVFERFFQVDTADTRKYGGTGIGLALAREFVELHGGRISARARVGEGASFTVELQKDRDRWHANYNSTGQYVNASSDLYIVDLSNPDAPSFASTVITNDPNGWWGNMKVVGNTLYTTHYVWPSSSVQNPQVRYYLDAIDLTDRKNPKVQASINVPGVLVGGSATDPSILYTIDYRWNTSSPVNEFDVIKLQGSLAYLQSSTPLDGWVGNVFLRGNTAYTSTQKYVYNSNQPAIELHQIDLSNPTLPVDRVASGPKGWGWLVDVQGDRMLVTSGWGPFYSPPGLDIYRLAPNAPPAYDQFVRTLGWSISSVSRQGNQLFLSSGDWGVQAVQLN
jgi:signal transduction histidine kinase